MVYPCPLFSGAKPSNPDGKFLVLFGDSLVNALFSEKKIESDYLAANQVPSYVGEHHFKEYPQTISLAHLLFFYVFKIFNMQSNWHSNYFILASRNIKIINSVTAAFTIVCQFVIV